MVSSLITQLVGQGSIPPPATRQQSRLEQVTGDNQEPRASGKVTAMGQVKPGTHIRFRLGGDRWAAPDCSDRRAGPQWGDTSKVKPGSHLVGPGPGMLGEFISVFLRA